MGSKEEKEEKGKRYVRERITGKRKEGIRRRVGGRECGGLKERQF